MKLKDRLVTQMMTKELLAPKIIAVTCTKFSNNVYFYQGLESYLVMKGKINDYKRNRLAFYFKVLQ